MPLPRLLADLEPAPGLIKEDYEDFLVEEIPLYPMDERGTHTFFLIEKAGLTTLQAVADLARALNVRRQAIGFAGMKDARAVTRQWLSVEHIDPDQITSLEISRLRILEVHRHGNKLRLGHLKGNRFTIRVRQSHPLRLAELQDGLATLTQRGVPNYFGRQRFGGRGDTWAIGRAILRGQPEEAVNILLGGPAPTDPPRMRAAREAYDAGAYEHAARTWPAMFRDERRALRSLIQRPGNRRRALSAIDARTRQLYVSAYQSHLFNQIVADRLPEGLGQLLDGDLAWLHASGAVFHVEHAADEQPRADRFDISPSGPLFGYRMTAPAGRPGEMETALLAGEALPDDAFRAGALRVKGARRPLRFQPADAELRLGADERGPYLELRFSLPRGCYATSLLRELFSEEGTAAADGEPSGTEESLD
ncbi:MAG: tRNA pseudouridine(13) synthase TruD [Phycisphaerae bacterium]|jgi:tRNA pseudouridine13 synthase